MKKLLICLFSMLLLSSIAYSNDVLFIKMEKFAARVLPYDWSEWINTNIDCTWDMTDKRIIIYSENRQIFDYDDEVYTEKSDYILFTSKNATDSNYKNMYLEIYVYKATGNGYLKVLYNDAEYKYKMRRIK